MPPDSPYDTRLGRESGKLTSAPLPQNFVARTPMFLDVIYRTLAKQTMHVVSSFSCEHFFI